MAKSAGGRTRTIDQDMVDLEQAALSARRSAELIRLLDDPKYAGMSPSQKSTALREALAPAHNAMRFIEGVLDRNGYFDDD